jgi:hypothetical protein
VKKILTGLLGSVLSFLALQVLPTPRGPRFSHPVLSASEPTAEEKGFRNLTQRLWRFDGQSQS